MLHSLGMIRDGWKRTNILPDDQFTQCVNLEHPSSWTIFFGLVEPRYEEVYLEVWDGISFNITSDDCIKIWQK